MFAWPVSIRFAFVVVVPLSGTRRWLEQKMGMCAKGDSLRKRGDGKFSSSLRRVYYLCYTVVVGVSILFIFLCRLQNLVQVFKKLAGKEGGQRGPAAAAAGAAGGGGLEWPYSSRPSNFEKVAKFAARIGLETAAGYALWELYKAVTAASA